MIIAYSGPDKTFSQDKSARRAIKKFLDIMPRDTKTHRSNPAFGNKHSIAGTYGNIPE
jgi:hypothetical protein